ncbi:MAG: Ig-like domain-containing protein [Cyclobacteriaceae bacterium]
MIRRGTILIFGLLILCFGEAQSIKIDVNVNHKHTVGGVESFDRKKFITIHSDQIESDWDMGTNAVDDLRDDFLNRLDVYMGRNTGPITGAIRSNQLNEDSGRPGFADSTHIAEKGATTRENYQNSTIYKTYESRNDLIIAAQLHPFWPDEETTAAGWAFSQEDTDEHPFGFATGEYMGHYIKNHFGGDGQPAPKWIEVINEPMWHLYDISTKSNPEEIFRFHNGAAKGIRSVLGNTILIGGYCTAFPDFEKDNFGRWEDRWKRFIDMSGDQMDFWTIHLYDWPSINGGQQHYRKGSNIEATMDMLEQYSLLKLGHTKSLMISEYGAQMHDYAKDPWTPYRDWLHVKSSNAQMMHFMSRPDIINKAIPFNVLKAEWGREEGVPYNHRLMRQAKEGEGEEGDEWVYTDIVHFYELWSEVKGTRVDIKSIDPDIQVDAYVDGSKVYVILNNLYFEAKDITISIADKSATALTSLKVKHYHLNDAKDQGVIDEQELSSEPAKFKIDAEGTMILEYTFGSNLTIDESKQETKYYATSYLQPITAGSPINFNVNEVTTSNTGEAMLRLGLGRDHGRSLRPKVLVNDKEVFVPANFMGGDQAQRGSFFGVIDIPVPYEYLTTNNKISVTFNDAGGHVSSVALRVFNYSTMPGRSAGDPVTGVGLNRESQLLPIDGTIQLTETVEPASAGNKKVTWSSTDVGVATVDSYGLVTAKAEGDAYIVVTTEDGAYTDTTLIKVRTTVDDWMDCSFLPKDSIESQQNYQFTVKYVAGENKTLVVDVRQDPAVWQGSAIIDLPFGEGEIDVTVFMNEQVIPGDSARVTAYIRPTDSDWTEQTFGCTEWPYVAGKVNVESMSLEADADSLEVGETMSLKAIFTPDDATIKDVKWSSSDSEIASVNVDGKLFGKLPGEVVVTGISKDNEAIRDSLSISLYKIDVDTIDISNLPRFMVLGDVVELDAIITPNNATHHNLVWSTANIGIAKVSRTGVLEAVGLGKTTIKAEIEKENYNLVFPLTVLSEPLGMESSEVIFYPNPVKDKVIFQGLRAGAYEMIIRDTLGRVCKTLKFESIDSVSIGELNQGLYLVELRQGDDLKKIKLIKHE